MATDRTWESGVVQRGSGDVAAAFAAYGLATPASIDAAIRQAGTKGEAALNAVENLTVKTATVDSAASASSTLTGVAPNLTLNLSIPRGRPGLDGGHAMDASANRRGLTPLLRAMGAGEARIVVMGDSNSEGFFLQEWDQRWMNVLRDKLRARWNITGDQGRGYLPATYNTLGEIPPKPTRGGAAGNTTPIANIGGLGLRSMWMKGDGTVTWPTLTFSATTPLRVLINRRFGHGSIEILVDGAVKATVPSGGTDAIIVQDITVTAGTHTVSARGQGGATVQIAGIEHRTGQGVAVYDGALSGATARTFTDPSPGQALHWSEVQRINPHLLIVALGANDMAPGQSYSRTPQQWENDLAQIVALRDQHAPNAGLLLLHAAAPTNDPAGLDRLREYEARAHAALEDAPRTSILYLSSLWQPRLDHTYTLMSSDPDGWLTDGVHMTAAAHSQVADLILGALASNMPAAKGDPGTTTAHAATHATGGSDPITPASIGAAGKSEVYTKAQTYSRSEVDSAIAAGGGGGRGAGLTEDPEHPGLYLIDQVQEVTATAPTFTDVDGTANDRYTIPSKAGVEYLVDGIVKPAGTYTPTSGQTLTITARPTAGYTLTGTASWTHTYSTGVAPVPVTANVPTADDNANLITWTPKAGVEYVIGGAVRTPPYSVGSAAATVTVEARAQAGYTLTGTTSWTFTFTQAPVTPATPATAYANAVMADAPVVFYMLDEPAGVTPVDSMGNSTATVLGGVTLGAASILEGATSAQIANTVTGARAITIGKPSALNNLTAWTFEMVIRAEGNASGLLNRSDAETNPRVSWAFDGTPKLRISMGINDHADDEQSFAWSTPQHLAATYDGTTVRLYTNGVEVYSAAQSGWTSGNPTQGWEIGRQDSYSGGRGSFSGRMAGVAIHSQALTPARILAHAQAAGLAT